MRIFNYIHPNAIENSLKGKEKGEKRYHFDGMSSNRLNWFSKLQDQWRKPSLNCTYGSIVMIKKGNKITEKVFDGVKRVPCYLCQVIKMSAMSTVHLVLGQDLEGKIVIFL